MANSNHCRDCDSQLDAGMSRREFVQTTSAAAAAVSVASVVPTPVTAAEDTAQPEQLVVKLYDSLTDEQREVVCFSWDHEDDRGLLRTHVSNNWSIIQPPGDGGRRQRNPYVVGGSFFTADQQDMIEAIFYGLYNPDWHDRIRKQLQDDAGGYGRAQTFAIFGEPGSGKFEFVMTGRHLTIRCDGDSAEHVAFGGPIFYGHAAEGFDEEPDHPGNVFWHQAIKANKLYQMLDGKQREVALIPSAPAEADVPFQGADGEFPGIAIADLTKDQQAHAQEVLQTLLEPYRTSDQDEALKCLKAQGGLEKCSLSFYADPDIGGDGVWDVWRIEGPSFVWHYRGAPHVHVWANVADDSTPELNAIG